MIRKLLPALTLIAASAVFSVWAYPHLPDRVATHFDWQGEPNGWSSRTTAAMLLPLLGLGLTGLFIVLPRIDPRRANYARFGPTYWTIINAVLILLQGLHILSLGKALGWPVDMSRFVMLGVGGLFVLLGSLMPRIQPNWFMGIRTPWTLSSDRVWRKTHQFGGMAFMIAGACLAATGLVTSRWALYAALGVAGVAAVSSIVYSFIVWKHEQEDSTAGARRS